MPSIFKPEPDDGSNVADCLNSVLARSLQCVTVTRPSCAAREVRVPFLWWFNVYLQSTFLHSSVKHHQLDLEQ